MDAVALYRRAWDVIRADLFDWVVFYAVFFGISLLTCGFGVVLMPNAHRELRDSLREQRPPQVGALFRTDRIANDAMNALLYGGAMGLGGAVGGIGASVAAVALQFQMPLAADDRYNPVDNARLSFQHVSRHPADHIVLLLVGSALALPTALLCFLPLPLVAPVIGMAHQLWYEDNRDELDGMAAEMGLKAITGPTGPGAG